MAKKLTDSAYNTLLDWFFLASKFLARKHGILPGEMMNYTKKGNKMTAARMELVDLARSHVGVRRTSPNTQEIHIFPRGIAAANVGMGTQHAWKPLGFRTLSCLLGITHGSLSKAQSKRLMDNSKDDPLTSQDDETNEEVAEQEPGDG